METYRATLLFLRRIGFLFLTRQCLMMKTLHYYALFNHFTWRIVVPFSCLLFCDGL